MDEFITFWRIIGALCGGVFIFLIYLKFVVFSYWRRLGVPHEEPSLPFGNATPCILDDVTFDELIEESYAKFKESRAHGIYLFHQPILMINDLNLVRSILTEEFAKFDDRGVYHNDDLKTLSSNLFSMPCKKWIKYRDKLSELFDSENLKCMFHLLQEINDDLINVIGIQIRKDTTVELKKLTSAYAMDSMTSMVLGFNPKTLQDSEDNEFERFARMIRKRGQIIDTLVKFAPQVLNVLGIKRYSNEIVTFFTRHFQDMLLFRRQNNVKRVDLFDSLMRLIDTDDIDEAQALAQAFDFFMSGYKSVSAIIIHCLYELAKHQIVQEKLYNELEAALESSEGITYDTLTNRLEFLNMIISETLRKYPPESTLHRRCTKDYDIPDSDVKVKKGTRLMISVAGLHRDSYYYSEPEKFEPARFTKKNITFRNPYLYLTFGNGYRDCIGSPLALVLAKTAVVNLLLNFKLSTCNQTPKSPYLSKRLIDSKKGEVFIKIERRHKWCML